MLVCTWPPAVIWLWAEQVILGRVTVPNTLAFTGADGRQYAGGGSTWFSLWTSNTAIDLFSAGGNLTPSTQISDPKAGDVNSPLANANSSTTDGRFVYPSILRALAAQGSLYLGVSATGNPAQLSALAPYSLLLAPSATGDLQLLAGDSIYAGGYSVQRSGTTRCSTSGADTAGMLPGELEPSRFYALSGDIRRPVQWRANPVFVDLRQPGWTDLRGTAGRCRRRRLQRLPRPLPGPPLNLAASGTPLADQPGKVVRLYDEDLVTWLGERFGFEGDAEAARAYLAGLPAEQQRIFARQVYFEELKAGGREYNDASGPRPGSYLRGRNAIAALFPSRDVAGNPISYDGDIVLFGGAGIHTNFGGDIQLLSPGGQQVFGVEGAAPAVHGGRGDPGRGQYPVLLPRQHPARAEPDHDHLRRGHPGLVGGKGDINAGRGTRPPWCTPRRCGSTTPGATSPCRRQVPSTGAGIATLNPIAEVAPGDIDLIAPQGTIDAGEAGIRVSGQRQHRCLAGGQRGQHPDPGQVHGAAGGGGGQHQCHGLGQCRRQLGDPGCRAASAGEARRGPSRPPLDDRQSSVQVLGTGALDEQARGAVDGGGAEQSGALRGIAAWPPCACRQLFSALEIGAPPAPAHREHARSYICCNVPRPVEFALPALGAWRSNAGRLLGATRYRAEPTRRSVVPDPDRHTSVNREMGHGPGQRGLRHRSPDKGRIRRAVRMMERYSKVGMQELDQRLSKIVEAARKRPVSVYRYGAPWVWIVSQEDWQGALREVSSCIPPGHSLALLRPADRTPPGCRTGHPRQVARRCNLRVDPSVLVKALLLRLLYSVPSEQHLPRTAQLQPAVPLVRRPGDGPAGLGLLHLRRRQPALSSRTSPPCTCWAASSRGDPRRAAADARVLDELRPAPRLAGTP
ncbi:hypothetical protein L1887_46955 [Cichorium endivia]|nr:hypothetical protein L1887_46955 [Cichorium endivia]